MSKRTNHLDAAKGYLADAETAEPSNPTEDTALLVQIARAHTEIAAVEQLVQIRRALTAIHETIHEKDFSGS